MASTRKTEPEPGAGPQDEDQAAAAAAADPAPAEGPLVMEYLDHVGRTYLFPGAPPQTAEHGDVCELPYDPQDGRWAATKRKVSRRHDAHEDEVAKRSGRQAAERAKAHGWKPTEQAADAAGEA